MATVAVKRKVLPPSGLGVTHSCPPCASTIERLMARPMPSPLGLVVTNGANSRVADGRVQPAAGVAHGDLDGRAVDEPGLHRERARLAGHRLQRVERR